MDADGDLDVVTKSLAPDFLSQRLSIRFQVAPRVFEPALVTSFDTAFFISHPLAADFDGDMDMDLAWIETRDFQVTALVQLAFQVGPRSFELDPEVLSVLPSDVGIQVWTPSSADLDGDGDLDLLDANGAQVHYQRETGELDVLPEMLHPNCSGAIYAADVDGDGDQDLLTFNFNNGTRAFLLQIAPGTFGVSPAPAGTDACVDLDGDGDLDFVGPLQVALRQHDGGFHVESLPQSLSALRHADFDGDGDLDLIGANGTTGVTALLFQSSPGDFRAEPVTITAPAIGGPACVATADLDGDGDRDLVTANELGDDLTLLLQGELANFDASPLSLGGAGLTDAPLAVAAADLDGDGDQDLASANAEGDSLAVFLQAPAGFDPLPSQLVTGAGLDGPRSLIAADLDGDGDQDLASANSAGQCATIAFQDEPAVFALGAQVLGGVGVTRAPSAVAAADLDADGDLDLVTANRGVGSNGNDVTVFFQIGSGNFDPEPLRLDRFATLRSPVLVLAEDLDSDGDLDLIASTLRNVSIFFQSAGHFDPEPLGVGPAAASSIRSVAAADLDADGNVDLVAASQNSDELIVLRQLRPRSFASRSLGPFATMDAPVWALAPDLDGDGDLDLVSANRDSNGVSLFFGGQ